MLGVSFGYLLLLFAVAAFGDRRAALGRSVIDNAWIYALSLGGLLHRLDLLRQRRAGGGVRGLVPADLSRADAGDAARLDRGAQDGAHRADLPHHLDRRLHRQPLRQEPAARRAGHADHRGRHRALHRAAAEGGLRRLPPADRRPGAPRLRRSPGGGTARSTSRWRWPPSPSSSAPATSTAPSGTRAWSRPSPSSRVVKLVAFLAVGAFVTWGLFDGMADIWARAQAVPGAARAAAPRRRGRRRRLRLRAVVRADPALDALGAAPAAAVPDDGGRMRRRAAHPPRRLGLPGLPPAHQRLRAADRHRRAACCSARGGPTPRPSCCRCRWRTGAPALALFAYVGGLSAATGMLIVETIAVSTMVCNDLVMPSLLRLPGFGARAGGDLTRLLLNIRRAAHRRRADARLPLLPHRRRGLCAGLDRPDQLRRRRAVRPGAPRRHVLARRHRRGRARRAGRRLRRLGLHADAALGGEVRLDRRRASSSTAPSASRCSRPSGCSASPASTTSRTRCSGACSSTSRSTSASRSAAAPSAREASQALLFVDVFERGRAAARAGLLARPRPARRPDARSPAGLLGAARARALFDEHARETGVAGRATSSPDARLVDRVERQLAGAVGSASARVMVASVAQEEPLGDRRRARDPRRGLAAPRLRPRARGEVALARGGDRRAARRQRAAARASTT